MTSTTAASSDTKWFCRHHFQNLDDPATCQRILDELERLPLPRCQDWRDEALELWQETHSRDPLVKRAMLLAAGKGDRQDKREHLQELARLARGIASPLPYNPTKRQAKEEEEIA